jgi:anti-sigma B factor antagonist
MRSDLKRKMEFAVTSHRTGPESWLIALRGEVDLYTAPAFKTELLSAVESGANNVIVDLSETTFFDSTALGVVLIARKRLRNGGQICIISGDRNITRIFEITGLDQIFAIFATIELAQSANHPHSSEAPVARPALAPEPKASPPELVAADSPRPSRDERRAADTLAGEDGPPR